MSKKKKKVVKKVDKVINAQDYFNNSLSQVVLGGTNPYGSQQITQTDTLFKNLRYYMISNNRQLLSQAYAEIGLIQTLIDVPVDDALRGGIKIKTDQLKPEEIEDLQSRIEQDDDVNKVGQAMKWNRLYGGAAVLIMTEQDPETPLDIEAINEDSKLEFRPVDMWELFGDKQYTGDNFVPSLNIKSEYYTYYSQRMHNSRVMIMKGKEAPSFIRPRLRGWGMSALEPIVAPLNEFLKTNALTFEVLDEFKLDIFKIKGFSAALMTPGGTTKIQERVQLANMQKNFQNAMSMDADDDYTQKQLSFAGIAEISREIRMNIASEFRMPLTKIFGISAAGFSSGEDDIENYNGMIESSLRNKDKPTLIQIAQMRCQQLYGFVPDDLTLEYEPLRILSSTQVEDVKDKKFSRLFQARQANEISTKEFREGCNKEELLPNNLEEKDILALDDNEKDSEKENVKSPSSNTKSTTQAPEAKA
jgi:phage-related protein (TIGR01555 family)